MQFNNNSGNNSRDNQVNVNTRGVAFMNREGFEPSTLQIGYWNDMLSLRIHPALEKSKQTESKVFDYEQNIATALTIEKAAILADKIRTDIFPAIGEGRDAFKGVPVGGDSLAGVGVKTIDGRIVTYFGIYKSLDPKTKRPSSMIHYEFRTTYTVDNYDPEKGSFEVTQDIQGELLMFYKILNSCEIGLANSVAHSGRVVDKFYRDRLLNTLDEVAQKMGVSTGNNNSRGGYKNNRADIFSGGANSGGESSASKGDPKEFDAPVGSLANIDDIDAFMQ
jgi:hypothetical protein